MADNWKDRALKAEAELASMDRWTWYLVLFFLCLLIGILAFFTAAPFFRPQDANETFGGMMRP